jgi:hypothetical protein
MRLFQHPTRLAIVKLAYDAAVPPWALSGEFSSITRTSGELSIVCELGLIPRNVQRSETWMRLEVEGPLPFSLVGVLAALTVPLAEAGVSVFPLATYDTDHLLIRRGEAQTAYDALTAAGHEIVTTEPPRI